MTYRHAQIALIELLILGSFSTSFVKAAAQQAEPAPALPSFWLGDWKGTLKIQSASGKVQEVPMELHIHPLRAGQAYQWQIVYGAGAARQLRNYELVPDDKRPGHFVIDEKDGIVLDADLIGGALCSTFQVGTSLLVTRYESRSPGCLHFEVASYRSNEPHRTAAKDADKDKDAVLSYPVATSQTAELTLITGKK